MGRTLSIQRSTVMTDTVNARVAYAEDRLQARDLVAAVSAYDDAEEWGEDPDRCAAGRWMAHMLSGNFEAAWHESDLICERGARDPHRFWQGEDLTHKRVILRCLHGLGDTVQFLRYAPLLQARASELIVQVPPQMLELAGSFRGVSRVITWGETAPAQEPAWDVQIEINELPYVFRTRSGDLPLSSRYLRVPAPWLRATSPEPADEDSLLVGVVWASGEWNPSRSITLETLDAVLQTCGCEFWNLQGGPARTAWAQQPRRRELHDADLCAESLPNLAALIAQLDLVITTDTLAAHLAGAQGVPAWVLLDYAADWRWQHERDDSPWYPSLRLFRQPSPGDWDTVIRKVRSALQMQAMAQERRRTVSGRHI
jgi:hypothetical protein